MDSEGEFWNNNMQTNLFKLKYNFQHRFQQLHETGTVGRISVTPNHLGALYHAPNVMSQTLCKHKFCEVIHVAIVSAFLIRQLHYCNDQLQVLQK